MVLFGRQALSGNSFFMISLKKRVFYKHAFFCLLKKIVANKLHCEIVFNVFLLRYKRFTPWNKIVGFYSEALFHKVNHCLPVANEG